MVRVKGGLGVVGDLMKGFRGDRGQGKGVYRQ